MRRGLNARLLGGSLVLLVLVVAGFALTLRAIDGLHDANRDLQRSLTAIAAADRVERLAVDAETAQRGFIITEDEAFLAPYRDAQRQLPSVERGLLEALSSAEAAPRRALAQRALRKVDEYVDVFVAGQIDRVRQDPARAREIVAAGFGKRRVDAIRSDFAALETAEREHAARTRADADASADRALLLALVGLIVAPLIVAAYAGYLSRLVVAPIRRVAAAAHRIAGGDLNARVEEHGVAEAAVLARSFNTMAASAQHSRDELENQNAELEAQQGELERTFAALAEEKERSDAFHRVVARLSAAAELDELADVLLAEIGDALGADAGMLHALDVADPDGPLVLVAARGFDVERLPRRLAPGAGLAGRALRERRLVHAEHGEGGLRVPALGGEAPLRHELHLPLLGARRVAGVLSFGRIAEAPFGAGAVDLASRLADPGAVALGRALTTQYAQHHAELNRAVVETAQDAFISSDADGIVVEWTPQAEALFGWSAEEALGRSAAELLLPPDQRDGYGDFRGQVLAGAAAGRPETHRREVLARHRDGRELTVELSIAPLRIGGAWRVNAFIRDVTSRVVREREREARSQVSRVLAEVEGREALVAPTLAALGEAMEWPFVAFWLPDSQGRLVCAGTWRAPGEPELDTLEGQTRAAVLGPDGSFVRRAWESGEGAWTRPDGAATARSGAAARAALRIAGAIPVQHGAHRLGVVEFWQRDATPPDPELFETLDAVGGFVVQVVEKRAAEAEADRLKNEFFALVSHELRTPLTSIVGYLELVLEGEVGEVNAEQTRFLGIVERNAKRLQRLVGDLLFVAQVEAGTLALDRGRAALHQVVRESVEGARPRAEQVGVEVLADAEELPEIAGDPDRLGQLVDNLVSNALKFTPEGGRVTVRLRERIGEAVLEVSDTGIGIPADEQARLFERFFRASTAVEGEIPGIGLGLSICQAIAEGHGGRIEVESEVGQGTTFRVVLPLAERRAAAATSTTANGASTT